MNKAVTRELEVALRCAVAAAEVCQRVQAKMVSDDAITKDDKSPVTVADFGSQAVVCRILKESFPSDSIVAEETSRDLRMPENGGLLKHVAQFVTAILPDTSEERVCEWIDLGTKATASRYWCLDPIDGTKGFLRGDQYAVALALVVEGKVQLGVLACPNLPNHLEQPDGPRGVLLWAVLGQGAFQRSLDRRETRPIRVSQAGLGGAIRFCESFESGHSDHEAHGQVAQRLGITAPSIRMDSQAKYGIVARGDASIYLRLPNPKTPDYREKVWDHAAGTIIIEEAGGKVTDINGKPLNFGQGYKLMQNSGVVATNRLIHDEVLAALRH